MKKIFTLLVVFATTLTTSAQYYNQALGLRFNDYYAALTYKTFLSEKNALDFSLNAQFDNGFGLTGLYEIHEPTGFADRLNWYYGIGGHVSLWSGTYWEHGNYSIIGLGVDGVVGVEYAVENIPFAFSLDYIPSFSLVTQTKPENYPGNWEWDGSSTAFGFNNWTVGVKYTFGFKKKEEEGKEERIEEEIEDKE